MVFSKRLFSPLRYPGGKGRFAPFIAQLIVENDLEGCQYIEPFAGGAAVALDLLFSGTASQVHINDIDRAIFDFWEAATSHSDALIDLLESTPVTIDEWHKWRAVLRGHEQANQVERGFATLFMNRTNRSGILQAGVIGGKAQSGTYRLDARFNRAEIGRRLEKIAVHREAISVSCLDAAELLRRADEFMPSQGFVYLDPPYFVKGQGLYRNYYEPGDHQEIADIVQAAEFPLPWLVSYDDAPEIVGMYKQSVRHNYELSYSAQNSYAGAEVMFFSDGLRPPSFDQLPRRHVV